MLRKGTKNIDISGEFILYFGPGFPMLNRVWFEIRGLSGIDKFPHDNIHFTFSRIVDAKIFVWVTSSCLPMGIRRMNHINSAIN